MTTLRRVGTREDLDDRIKRMVTDEHLFVVQSGPMAWVLDCKQTAVDYFIRIGGNIIAARDETEEVGIEVQNCVNRSNGMEGLGLYAADDPEQNIICILTGITMEEFSFLKPFPGKDQTVQ